MLKRFRDFWQKLMTPPAKALIAIGATPDLVTLIGTIGVVAGALVFYPTGHLLIGSIVIACFVFSDMVDGLMSRILQRSTKFGAFLDSSLDRIGDAAIFGGLALYFDGPGHYRMYVIVSFVCLASGSVTSYVRAKAESLGYEAKGGLAERTDRLVISLVATGFSVLLGWPWLMYAALWFVAAASTITVVQRLWVVYRQSRRESDPVLGE